jgi:predicted permease
MSRVPAGRSLARSGLVTLQFALALPLLVAAGLLLNSLMHLHRVDPGFDTQRLLTARVRLLETRYPDAPTRLAFWERALTELRAVPGVTSASLATGVPPDSPFTVNNFDLVGRPAVRGSQPVSPWTPVWDGFLEALGVPILEGRGLHAGDRLDTEPVVLVSRSWAERFFPGESAVGRQLYEGGDLTTPLTIVGVTGDVNFVGLAQPGVSVYAPISPGGPDNPPYLYLRTNGDPLTLAAPLRSALGRLDPAVLPTEVTTMQRRLRDSLGDERHWAVVIIGFALAAVLLSAVGISGVLAYYVSRQYREIGIRLALGADAGRVLGMVIRRGLACALCGSAIGVVLAMFLARGLESLLFEVRGTDPATLAGACALLLVVALLASWLPARRAARVDAAIALRAE